MLTCRLAGWLASMTIAFLSRRQQVRADAIALYATAEPVSVASTVSGRSHRASSSPSISAAGGGSSGAGSAGDGSS